MKHVLSSLLTMTVLACGSGAPLSTGKPAAAQAVAALSTPTKASTQRDPKDVSTALNGCARGGSVTLSNFTYEVDLSEGTVASQRYTMELNDCALATSASGDAHYSGKVQVTQRVYLVGPRSDIAQTFSGRLTIGGAFDDFLETEITQTVSLADLGADHSVSAVFKGSVSNRSGTYTFNESVDITAGQLTSVSAN